MMSMTTVTAASARGLTWRLSDRTPAELPVEADAFSDGSTTGLPGGTGQNMELSHDNDQT